MGNELTPTEPPSFATELIQKFNLPEMIAGPAGKAISRLIAGAVEIPAAYLDAFAQSIKNKTEAKKVVSNEVATAAAKLAASDTNVVARAAHNLLAKEFRNQQNKEAIARKTIEILEEEAPTDPGERNANQENRQPAPDVDEDWLNIFERHAADASSERMQMLWARVLAGEIRKPKTFSLKSLRYCRTGPEDSRII